jgi:hypothetical protein
MSEAVENKPESDDKPGILAVIRRKGWRIHIESTRATIAQNIEVAKRAHPSAFRDDNYCVQFGFLSDNTGVFTPDFAAEVAIETLGYPTSFDPYRFPIPSAENDTTSGEQ